MLANARGPLRYLLVDEYQDINPAQERLIQMLAGPPVELTIVGDDDLSIYQRSGSDIRNILKFRQRNPLSATVELDTNRRFASSHFLQPMRSLYVRDGSSNQIISWSAEADTDDA